MRACVLHPSRSETIAYLLVPDHAKMILANFEEQQKANWGIGGDALGVNFWKRWRSWQGTGCAAGMCTRHPCDPAGRGGKSTRARVVKGRQVTGGVTCLPRTNDRSAPRPHASATRRPSCLHVPSMFPPHLTMERPIDRWGWLHGPSSTALKKRRARRLCL